MIERERNIKRKRLRKRSRDVAYSVVVTNERGGREKEECGSRRRTRAAERGQREKCARLAMVGTRHIVRLISGNFITVKLLVPGKYMRKSGRHLKFALPTIHTAGVYLIES